MTGRDIAAVPRPPALSGCIDRLAARILKHAARHAPDALSERLEEEWLADLSERRGRMSRLSLSLGCYWAAVVISHEQHTVSVPATRSSAEHRIMPTYTHSGSAFLLRRTTAPAPGAVMCEINTTPLIDVMLVLLVTMIMSLPAMTHAVKLDLPQTSTPHETPSEVINLEIDFDGTILWNGTAIRNLQQLETYFRTEAQKDPQPEIRLQPDRRAKYDFVAKVLASAQRNRLKKVGFTNTGEFYD